MLAEKSAMCDAGCSWKFRNSLRKTYVGDFFKIKSQAFRPATLLKRDPNTHVLLRELILKDISEQLVFYWIYSKLTLDIQKIVLLRPNFILCVLTHWFSVSKQLPGFNILATLAFNELIWKQNLTTIPNFLSVCLILHLRVINYYTLLFRKFFHTEVIVSDNLSSFSQELLLSQNHEDSKKH